jgi:putative ABC transport system permease protein
MVESLLGRLSALDRKLVRDLRGMLGQGITISLVVAAGIAGFITLRSTHSSLIDSRDAYYERYRFGDVFVGLERAPEALADRLERVPGVARVHTRVVELVRIPMEGAAQSPFGQVVSLPADGDPPLNALFLRDGSLPEPGRADEALLLEAFAGKWDLEVGDTLRVIMNGTLRPVRITGLAASPEFVYPMPPGGIGLEGDDRFGVLWMDRGAVGPIFRMEGAFNDAVLRLQPGASERAVLTEVDALLEPFGGRGAVGRANQPSNAILDGELAQLEQFAGVVPLIFLGVAAFLLNVVLSRLLNLQRTQIAALKALGYRDRQIALHYLKMTSGVMLAGTALGLALGAWLGSAATGLYASFFGFPVLEFRIGWGPGAAAVIIALAAGGFGAFGALRKVLRLSPAEAMSPEPPARYRPSILERLGAGRLVGPSGRMVLREVTRRRLRTALSALGIALAIAILVVGRFMPDALEILIDEQFYRAWKEDAGVTFTGPVPERGVRELLAVPGVRAAEGMRITSARIHSDHRWRDVPLQGYPEGAALRTLLDERGEVLPFPEGGVVLTSILGEVLGVGPGDTVRVTLREGRTREAHLVVAGLLGEMFGLQGHMRMADLNALLGEAPTVNRALLRVEGGRMDEVAARLGHLPAVLDVSSRDATVQGFREQSAQYLLVMTLIMTAFASVIAAGVVYNNARVAVAERERDLASLRVMGFTRREVSSILLGEMGVQVALAIPLGLWLGYRLCLGIAASVDPEMFRLPVILTPATYAFATGVVLAAAVASALLVRRRLDNLDLIGVLKTRE